MQAVRIDTVLLKVASRCNLNCGYCYVYNMGDASWRSMPKLMEPAVFSEIAAQLGRLYEAQEHPFAVVLHGGEPLMLGEVRLRSIFSELRAVLPRTCSLNVQTNGILLTSGILDICAEHEVRVSVSLDGPAHLHDKNRQDRRGGDSHAAVIAGILTLQTHPASDAIFSGVLAVVDPTSDPHEIYDYFASMPLPSIDFLYRDGNHATLPYGKTSRQSVEYGCWMSIILDRYLLDPHPPRIRVLDDMLRLLLGGAGMKEGVGLTNFGILVIDTDGSVTKNDTLKSSPGGDRFPDSWHIMRSEALELVRSREYLDFHRMQQPTAPICQTCSDLSICGGGMVAHRFSNDHGFENPTIYCADQRLLIKSMRSHLAGQLSRKEAQ